MKKSLFIAALLILKFTVSYGQSIVINEYYNADNPTDEWIELLVVEDNLDISNFSLLDCYVENEIATKWGGGVQFTDNSLWKNLRAGTIIVLRNRGEQTYDINKRDGYIELGIENTDYCNKISYGTFWDTDCMSIDNRVDALQILNQFGSTVHTISHGDNNNGIIADIQNPFLKYPDVCSLNSSISVIPGNKLSDYSGGESSTKTENNTITTFITKGTPNQKQNAYDDNRDFWYSLRKPQWDTPSMSANVKTSTIDIFWTKCNDNNPNDLTIGYLIIRINEDELSSAQHPANGTTYSPGETIGSAIVVTNDANSLTTGHTDNFSFDCNESYIYRIYAYRYEQDHLLGNGISTSYSRGRTYNTEDYADVTVRKSRPVKPRIEVEGVNTYCQGDSVKLNTVAPGGPYEFTWFIDGNEIPNEKKRFVFAKNPGLYRIRITNTKGCYSESDETEIIELPSPQSEIFSNGIQIYSDTTIVMCENETVDLTISGGDRYVWLKEDVLTANTTNVFNISEEGLYYSVAINDGMECSDTSFRITVDLINIAYAFDKDTVYFNLDKYTSYEDKNVNVENLSSDTLNFLDLIIPPGGIFSIFAQPPSLSVNPFQNKDYRIRFEPDRAGNFVDSITFTLPCQNALKRVYLFAYKEPLSVTLDPENLSFSDKLNCETVSDTLTVSLSNEENFEIEFQSPILFGHYQVVNQTFPFILEADSDTEIQLVVSTNQPGDYDDILQFPFVGNGIKDILFINALASVKEVSYDIQYKGAPAKIIEFDELIGCEDSSLVTFQINNPGEIPISINAENIPNGLYFQSLPITVQPNSGREVLSIFVPEDQGTFNETVNFIIEPCEFEYSINFTGSKNGIVYKISEQDIDFGNIIRCIDSSEKELQFELSVSGEVEDSAYIERIIGPTSNFFEHNIIEKIKLDDINFYSVFFKESPLGQFEDSLTILIQPCEVEKKLYIHGNRIEPKYNLSSNQIDFGGIEIENKDTLELTIDNIGKTDITLTNISNISSPFSLLSILPIVIHDDSSITLLFEYSPILVQSDSINIIIELSEPCDLTEELILTGLGNDHPVIEVVLTTEEVLTGEPGNEISFNVDISSPDDRNLSDANIDSLKFSIEYNPTMLLPLSVLPGTSIILTEPEIKQTEDIPGISEVNAVIVKQEQVSDGTLFSLKFKVLLGNSMITPISIMDAEFYSKIEIIADTTSSVFKLESDCDIEKRLVKYDGDFQIISHNYDNESKLLEILINTDKELILEHSIFSLQGVSVIPTESIPILEGQNVMILQTDKLHSGIYFVMIKSKNSIEFIPISIIN